MEVLFAETERRVVAHDFTARFSNRYWQVPEPEAFSVRLGATKVVVERRL